MGTHVPELMQLSHDVEKNGFTADSVQKLKAMEGDLKDVITPENVPLHGLGARHQRRHAKAGHAELAAVGTHPGLVAAGREILQAQQGHAVVVEPQRHGPELEPVEVEKEHAFRLRAQHVGKQQVHRVPAFRIEISVADQRGAGGTEVDSVADEPSVPAPTSS
ncbi:MAG: hypothetical protein HY319_30650 [Armatimonadetes bacterium]|nr:hypothetical protein [Armatimonadota bacterium]